MIHKRTDGADCRELWAAIEARPPLWVSSVLITDTRHRWACYVRVPWSPRSPVEVGTREDLEKLFDNLAAFEAEQAKLLESPEVAAPADANPPAPPEAAPPDPALEVNAFTSKKVDAVDTAPADAEPAGQLSLFQMF